MEKICTFTDFISVSGRTIWLQVSFSIFFRQFDFSGFDCAFMSRSMFEWYAVFFFYLISLWFDLSVFIYFSFQRQWALMSVTSPHLWISPLFLVKMMIQVALPEEDARSPYTPIRQDWIVSFAIKSVNFLFALHQRVWYCNVNLAYKIFWVSFS